MQNISKFQKKYIFRISAFSKSCTKFCSTISIENWIPDRMVMVSEVSGQFHYRFSCIFDKNPAVPELDTPSFFFSIPKSTSTRFGRENTCFLAFWHISHVIYDRFRTYRNCNLAPNMNFRYVHTAVFLVFMHTQRHSSMYTRNYRYSYPQKWVYLPL